MMVWMCRELMDVLGNLMPDIASNVGQIQLIFIHTPAINPTQHDLSRQDDTQTTIDYHQLGLYHIKR
jgi:hypothetical protein